MPAPIISGLVTYLSTQLSITAWDGEIPRQDTGGTDIVLAPDACLFKVVMPESGFEAEPTFEDAFSDECPGLTFYLWSTNREQVELDLDRIETLFCNADNWKDIVLGGNYFVWKMLRGSWTCYMLEGMRDRNSNYIYEGQLRYACAIHEAKQSRHQ